MVPLVMVELSQPYPTMDECAKAAEASIAVRSFTNNQEWVGIILERGGEYFYSQAQSQHSDNRSEFHMAYSLKYLWVGIYHTHPGTEETTRWFSTVDTTVALKSGVVSYILDGYDMKVHRFIPHVDEVRKIVGDEQISLGQVLP